MAKSNAKKKEQDPRGKRFTDAQRAEALRLVATGLRRGEVARIVGTTLESLRRWSLAAKQAPKEKAHRGAAADPPPVTAGGGLAPVEVAAILEEKKAHPSMGPAQIRAQLKRFRGWRLSTKAIGRVLRANGYRLVHKGARPEGDEHHGRFEAPRRNALWQLDFCEVRVGAERCFLLFVLDDYSRFLVGHALCEAPSSEVAVATLEQAIAAHGKCEAVYTDRGGAFLAWRDRSGFQRFCETELIDHHVSKSYRPQGRGKVEALIATVQRELWNVRHFESVEEASRALGAWVRHYNERRAHMGIDGLTPADRFHGRGEIVRAALAARVRERQLVSDATAPAGAPLEEIGLGVPLEVLRLVLVDGHAELRFLGGRIRLGPVL
jgi:transposase InsO family protein